MAFDPNRSTASEKITLMPEHLDVRVASSLRRAHDKYGIPLNVGEIVNRTLRKNGFSPIEPALTPSVEEWIAERIIDQGYAGYNHGSFVTDTAGNLGFAKVHYGPDNIVSLTDEDGITKDSLVGGPKREAQVLEALAANGYEVPRVIGYSPESPLGATLSEAETYEVLVIEAVLPDYGAVRQRESWTPTLARKAAQKIATFAQPIETIPLFEHEAIPLPVEDIVQKLPRTGDDYERSITKVLGDYPFLDDPIVVHGDTWFNNIIARHDDSDIMFVDWELAGPGYRGQDAGRKLWDLTLKNDWRFAEYTEAAQAFTDEWCSTDNDRHSLAFGITYESLRWISDRIDQLASPDVSEAARVSINQEIEDIKSHTLTILNQITQE